MTRRVAIALFVAVLMVSPLAGLAAAQAGNSTATPTENSTATEAEPEWSPPGPFEIAELRTGGEHPSTAPPSVRYVGAEDGSADGAIALRYVPASPFGNEPQMLEPGTTLNTDRVQLYSTIFGEATGEYTFTVVYWQERRETVNGTTVTYAANQEVQRATVDVENGYATADIKLQSHFQDTYKATAWLEKDGERVPGARWQFQHASLPTEQQVHISTLTDAWWYTFRTAVLPGTGAIILGLSLARMTLRRVGRGPGWGLGAWAILGGIGVMAALGGLYYEVTVLIAHVDVLMGLSLGVVAYGGGLRMHPPAETIQFVRKELYDAKALRRSEVGDD